MQITMAIVFPADSFNCRERGIQTLWSFFAFNKIHLALVLISLPLSVSHLKNPVFDFSIANNLCQVTFSCARLEIRDIYNFNLFFVYCLYVFLSDFICSDHYELFSGYM